LVPPGSPITSIAEVDRKGVRIAYGARSAYGLWLQNNIKNATLMPTPGPDAFNRFRDEGLEVYAGLRPGLLKDVEKMPGATILPGKFSAVQQAVGTAKPNTAGATYLADFVEKAKRSGLVASLIQKHKVKGLSVAPRSNG
jgi:polar amino acid transport system substrate-binding protein